MGLCNESETLRQLALRQHMTSTAYQLDGVVWSYWRIYYAKEAQSRRSNPINSDLLSAEKQFRKSNIEYRNSHVRGPSIYLTNSVGLYDELLMNYTFAYYRYKNMSCTEGSESCDAWDPSPSLGGILGVLGKEPPQVVFLVFDPCVKKFPGL